MARSEDSLEVRHKLTRIVCEALVLIYSDGAPTADDSNRVADAIEVLTALQARSAWSGRLGGESTCA
jgi:hypothetical protein